MLQRLIKSEGSIRHPIYDGPCPVLQYADDSLLLIRADVVDIRKLKKVLVDFSSATGLQINYNKSTLVPMNIQQGTLDRIL